MSRQEQQSDFTIVGTKGLERFVARDSWPFPIVVVQLPIGFRVTAIAVAEPDGYVGVPLFVPQGLTVETLQPLIVSLMGSMDYVLQSVDTGAREYRFEKRKTPAVHQS